MSSACSPNPSPISTTPNNAGAVAKHHREMESQGSNGTCKTGLASSGPPSEAAPGSSSGANKCFKNATIPPPICTGGLRKPTCSLLMIKHGWVVKSSAVPEEALDGSISTSGSPVMSAPVINISDNEPGSSVASDGNEAVSTIKSRTHMAAQLAEINIVNACRVSFAQKYAGLTLEQTLALVSKGWCSAIYDHFAPLKIIKGANGVIIHRFTCKKWVYVLLMLAGVHD
ncbi:hypothetical protein C8Q76DRAFT_798468 [Earliella scabrosa]|nr:hypothetical protein C8Q76DRAFT_798468 [Earliella scabrosa]